MKNFFSILILGLTAMVSPVLAGAMLVASVFAPTGVIGANTFSSSVLQDARAFIKSNMTEKFQSRKTNTNILNLYLKDREFTMPELTRIKTAESRATKALYLTKKTFTDAEAKSCSPSGETSGSGSITLSWDQIVMSTKISHKQFYNNEVGAAKALAHNLLELEKSLFTALDVKLLAHLETNKSGVNDGTSGSFDTTNDIMAINLSNKNLFYAGVTTDMLLNDYNPEFLEAFSTAWMTYLRYYAAQGDANATNTVFQYEGFEHHSSNLITIGAIGSNTYTSVHYIVPTGGVAILDWNDPLNVQGQTSGEKTWGTYRSFLRPEFTFDLFKKTECADTTADGGNVQDLVETYELTLNFAPATQPVVDSGETAIFKYGIMNDDTFSS